MRGSVIHTANPCRAATSSAPRLSAVLTAPSHGAPTTVNPAAAISAARASVSSAGGGPHQNVTMKGRGNGAGVALVDPEAGAGLASAADTRHGQLVRPKAIHSTIATPGAATGGRLRGPPVAMATSPQKNSTTANPSDADMTW